MPRSSLAKLGAHYLSVVTMRSHGTTAMVDVVLSGNARRHGLFVNAQMHQGMAADVTAEHVTKPYYITWSGCDGGLGSCDNGSCALTTMAQLRRWQLA